MLTFSEFTSFAATFLLPVIALIVGYYTKDFYKKRKGKADIDTYEIDNYSGLYNKMRTEFIKLHNELIDNQNTILELQRQVSELTNKIEGLTIAMNLRDKTISDLSFENKQLRSQLGEAEL